MLLDALNFENYFIPGQLNHGRASSSKLFWGLEKKLSRNQLGWRTEKFAQNIINLYANLRGKLKKTFYHEL